MTIHKKMLRLASAAILLAGLAYAAPATAQSADLAVTIPAPPATIAFRSPTVYRVTVANAGPDAAAAVTVSATVPTGATVTAVTGCTPADAAAPATPRNWFPCAVTGSLANAATATVSVSVTYAVPATCPAADFYGAVTVTAASTTTDPSEANNSVSAAPEIALPLANLAVEMTGPSSIPHGGGTFVFNYTVTNTGPCAAPEAYLAVDDAVTTGFTWVSATGPCGGVDAGTGDPITGDFLADGSDYQYCIIDPLAAGASVTGTKTYHLVSLASDLISSNQGTGLQLITNEDYTDANADDDVSDVTYVVTKSMGCSTTGGGTSFLLLAVGLGFLFLKRRK